MSVPFYTQQTPESFRSDVAPVTKGVNERTLSRYLGEQLVATQPNPLDRLNYTARNLPDMFRGRRLQLQDSVEGFILNGFEFYTYLIPWLVTNEKSVKMNVYRHNVRAATPTPNKGVSRMQTHQTSTKEATVERFGAAFMMEGDMMGTPEGDRQYIRNLMGMAQGCQLRVNEETMAALIDCKNYVQDWMEYRGRRNWVEDVMEMEINRFAGMAADPNFLDQNVAQSISVFKNRSLVPGAIIGWETLPFLEAMVATGSKTGFWQLGPDGRDVFVAGPDAIASIQKLPLFLARPFTVNEDDGPKQFLSRDVTVGEYYPMSFTERRGELFGPGGSTYTSDQREIRIYDIGTDGWRAVTLKEALANSRIWYTNPGSYTAELREAVRDANLSVRKQNGFKEKVARYSDPAALDHQTKFTRTENMMFAHAPDARLMFLPLFIGQFDTDVIQTTDLRQMAQQFLQSAFGVGPVADKLRADVEEARAFVHRWEAEATDNSEFWDALAAENAARSTSLTGEWVGEQVAEGAPRDWKPNSKASLDLPQNIGVLFPPGFANPPGFETVIAQGTAKGYDASVVNGARGVNDVVSRVTRQTTRIGGRSQIAQAAATPEWFHTKKPEITTWEILFGRRAPIFLAAPTGSVVGTADASKSVRAVTGEEEITYNSYPGQYSVYGTMPVGALVASMLGMYSSSNAAQLTNSAAAYSTIFKQVVEPLSTNPTPEQIAANVQQEAARKATLNALSRRISQFTSDETKKYRGYYATEDVYNALDLASNPTVDAAYRAKFADLATSGDIKLKPAGVDKKNREYDEKYKQEQANKALIDAKAAEIFKVGYGDIEATDISTANNPDFINKRADLRKLLLPTKTKAQTPMTNLLSAIENVEKLGRRYGNFSWDNLKRWGAEVSSILNDEASLELADAIETYNAANEEMRNTWNSVFSTGIKEIALDSDEEGGRPLVFEARKPGKEIATGFYYFRAPLSMTRQLLYGSIENPAPRIRAADHETDFRTMFYPQHSPNSTYFEDEVMAMGKMPFMADIGSKELHDFHSSSVVKGMLIPASVSDDQHIGYKAPQHIISAARKFNTSTQKLYDATQSSLKRKSAAEAAQQQQESKKRGVGFTDSESPLTAAQTLQLQAQRGFEKSAFLRQQDADDDIDDKRLRSGAQFMSTGQGEEESSTATDAERREEIDQGLASLQARPQTTNDYNMLLASPTMAYRWQVANQEDELTRLAMLYIIMTRADDYLSQVALIDANVNLPYNFLIWRLHITISMYSLIVMVPGRETGVNIIGDRNFAMQEQVVDKIAVGHLTFYHKCVIWRPQNVDHLLDVYPHKYRAGWDMSWVDKAEDINSNPKKERGSLISWIMPAGEQITKAAVSFVGGSIHRMQPLTTNLPDTTLATVLTMAPFYADKVWKIDRTKTTYTGEIATFKKSRKMLNVVAYAGKYIAWDKSQKVWNLKTQGTGHLRGVKSGPLTREIWTGQSTKLFPQAITTQSLN